MDPHLHRSSSGVWGPQLGAEKQSSGHCSWEHGSPGCPARDRGSEAPVGNCPDVGHGPGYRWAEPTWEGQGPSLTDWPLLSCLLTCLGTPPAMDDHAASPAWGSPCYSSTTTHTICRLNTVAALTCLISSWTLRDSRLTDRSVSTY